MENICKYKIKSMTQDEMLLAIDRLTRFKTPEVKYNRVFREMISKYLIEPKISFKEYDNLSNNLICDIIEQIFQFSLGKNFITKNSLHHKIIEFENNIFEIDENTKQLMNAKVPYETILQNCPKKDLCKNLELLYHLINNNNAKSIRNTFATKFPIEKIILAEGITEEILLPKFSKILNYDFDKNGIEILAAGGKNQVAKEYLKLKEKVKLPIVILLDADADAVAQIISDKIRTQDKLILIEKGEFEDILSLDLIAEAINYKFLNIFSIEPEHFSMENGRVKDLEEIYRINGLGEFKKADFAHSIETVLTQHSDSFISKEIKDIIEIIKKV